MDEKLQAAVDEFVTERVNTLGANPPTALAEAFAMTRRLLYILASMQN